MSKTQHYINDNAVWVNSICIEADHLTEVIRLAKLEVIEELERERDVQCKQCRQTFAHIKQSAVNKIKERLSE